jgi:hypothetical protein
MRTILAGPRGWRSQLAEVPSQHAESVSPSMQRAEGASGLRPTCHRLTGPEVEKRGSGSGVVISAEYERRRHCPGPVPSQGQRKDTRKALIAHVPGSRK